MIKARLIQKEGRWFLPSDVFRVGKYYTSNANLNEVACALDANLRTGLRREKFDIELFVTNLFDENTPVTAQTFVHACSNKVQSSRVLQRSDSMFS